MSKILVTGGAGFIGFHLAKKLLEQNHQVIIVDNFNDYYDPSLKESRIKQIENNERLKIYRLDIGDFKKLQVVFNENKIDLVCHLAAQAGVRYSFVNPQAYLNSNVSGTFNLLELAKEKRIKNFIFGSSSSVYGNLDKEAFAEDDVLNQPVSLYAATKLNGEAMAYYYHHAFGLNVICLRFFTVYGPWGRPDMALFKFTRAILAGEKIDVYNHGRHQRDFTYVDDIIDGIIKAMELKLAKPSCTIINLGNSRPVELEYFIALIEKNLNKKAAKNYLPLQPGDVLKTSADISRAKKILNWQPATAIETGLKKFIDWYLAYYQKG